MPIDPNIALGVKPPVIPNLNEIRGQQMALRNMRDVRKLNAQQSQVNDLDIQQKQRTAQKEQKQVVDEKAYEDIVRSHTSYDPEKGIAIDDDAVMNDLIQAGHPEIAQAHQVHKQTVHKAALDQVEKEMTLHLKKSERFAALAQSVLNGDPANRPGLYSQALQQAQAEQLIDPQHMSAIPQQYDPASTDALLKQLVDETMSAKDQISAAQAKITEQRTVATSKADLLKKNIENEAQILGAATDQAGWDNALAQLDEERKKKYPAEFSEQARMQALSQGISPETRATLAKVDSPTELAMIIARGGPEAKLAQKALDELKKYGISVEVGKIMAANAAALGGGGTPGKVIPAATLGQRNESALSGLSPGVTSVVRQLVDYKIQLPSGMALKTPYWQQVLEKAGEFDPDFDASQYNVRLKLRQDFTSGKAADNVKSLNTVVGHLDKLHKAGQALDNSSIKKYNSVANWLASETGDKRVVAFEVARNAVANELTKVFRGTGGAEADIKSWKESIDTAGSPEQLQEAIDSAIDLMGSRLEALNSQYTKGMGKPRDFSFLDAKARKILKDLGADVDALDPVTKTEAPTAPPKPDVQAAPAGKKITEDLVVKGLSHNKLSDTPANRQAVKAALKGAGYTE